MVGNRFRELKRRARRDLHRELEVPALYLLTSTSTPVPCTVRVWTKWGAIGQLPGKGQGWAEIAEAEPKIIFMVADVPNPRTNALVSIEPGEAYRVIAADPADDISVTAKVVRLNPKEPVDKALLDALPLPVDLSTPSPTPSAPQVGVGVPAGGLKGDVLRKKSDADWDLVWVRGSFTFTQSTPLMQWTIPHNLGRIPVIAIVGVDGREIEGEVAHSTPDYNTTSIIFSAPTAGAARLS